MAINLQNTNTVSASSIKVAVTSVERSTVPFLRASSRRLGVAFSVFPGSAICSFLFQPYEASAK